MAWTHVKEIETPNGKLSWHTLPGVFAKGGLDPATALLISTLDFDFGGGRILDFCCGTGLIAASIRERNPTAELHLLDADTIALETARLNVANSHYYTSDGFLNAPSMDFDWIISNPPIHRGREEKVIVFFVN